MTAVPLTLQGGSILFGIEEPERELEVEPIAVFRSVTADYFRALGVPLVEGRGFDPSDDASAPRVAVVNELFAKQYFRERRAVGERIDIWGDSAEIVGVVGDVVQFSLGRETRPAIYVAAAQRSMGFFDPKALAVRTVGNPTALAAAVREQVWAIDRDQPIGDIRTMPEIVSGSLVNERLQTRLLSAFGVAALLLAALGIYGVLSYLVVQRTDEIGLRMALGAGRPDVVRWIAQQGMRPVLVGIGLGLVGAIGLSRVLSGMIHGVSPSDPWTLGGISVLLSLVALVACVVPAMRASRVDPLVALQDG